MRSWRKAALAILFLLDPSGPLMAETIRLSSGREVEIVDGNLIEKVAEDLYREAEGLVKKGRLDLASDYWRLILDKAKGGVISQARAAQENMRRIEYGSFILLRSGRIVKGRVKAGLRADLLGLEGKEEIPLWQVEEVVAEYHAGYSQVSKTFYPLTLLEIRFRAGETKTSRMTQEVEFVVETPDGSVTKALLGKEYELLRPADLGKQLESTTTDRIVKAVIYPGLRRSE